MDEKKIAVIVYKTNDKLYEETAGSIQQLSTPENFSVEIILAEGANKYAAFDSAMKQSDAKYKIYLDDCISIRQKNILSEIVKLFKSNEKIGVIGCSGATALSTHGICLTSAKRCGKVLMGANRVAKDWGNVDGNYQEVAVLDGWFMATQYDLNWRSDIFKNRSFGEAGQCVEFKRKGYKVVVIAQKKAWIWFKPKEIAIDEESRLNFLKEYSEDLFPLVSVIIPTFNRPEYFKIALDSVLNQTYRNFEILVSDNSTNDDTENMMKEYCARDKRIKYHRHHDFTANDNWNFARSYNNPDAEFVNWLMDDDMFYPRKLELMVEAFRNNPDVSLVTSVRDTMDAAGNITGRMPDPLPSKILSKNVKLKGEDAGRLMFNTGKNYIGEPTTGLIRKKFLRNNDMCWTDEEGGFYSLVDISTWCQLLEHGNMFWFAEPLSAFRRHEKQATNWQGNGAIFEISWARLFKTSWEKKVFTHTEDEIRERIINWIYSASLRLVNAHKTRYHGGEITTLEKTIVSMAQALSNGYHIDLPPREYGDKTKAGRIS